jgi:response regulator RpfG family c-di-GMP phosphodiesterase
MRSKGSGKSHRSRKLILLVDQNRPVAERRVQLLRTIGYEVDHAGSEIEADSLVRHRRYDLVLLAFHSRTDVGKATSMCIKLELTTPHSVVGWLVSHLTLIPARSCPTVVWEDQELKDFVERIRALVASRQKCRAVCVFSEDGECAWGVAREGSRRDRLSVTALTLIQKARAASKKNVMTAPPQKNDCTSPRR